MTVLGFDEVTTIEELDRVLSESSERPVLLFKHSNACAVSFRALSEFQRYLQDADPRVSYKLITVQDARSVSNEAASRLNVEHHTPQAVLIRNGRALWDASHFAISAASLAEAIRATT